MARLFSVGLFYYICAMRYILVYVFIVLALSSCEKRSCYTCDSQELHTGPYSSQSICNATKAEKAKFEAETGTICH